MKPQDVMTHALKRRVVAAVAMFGLPAILDATVAVQLSDEAMVAQAELIITGECRAVDSAWVGGDLVTFALVAVDETLKGEPRPTVSVALPGGIDLDRKFPIASIWAGAPTLMPGERVFLFLDADEGVGESPIVVGFSQGKFSISSDARGRKTVSRDLHGTRLLHAGEARPGDRRSIGLGEFTSRIRALVDAELVNRAGAQR